jgi:N-acetylmuramoyl-L-alanine amidase
MNFQEVAPMNITYMKTLVVCLAALSFIGLENSKAKAFNKFRDVKGDNLWIIRQQNNVTIDDLKQVNNLHNNWFYIEEILEMSDKTKRLTVQSSKSVMEISDEAKGLVDQSSNPIMEMPDETKGLTAQLSNPLMEMLDETKRLTEQSSNPVMEMPDETKGLTEQSLNPVMEMPDETKGLTDQSSNPVMEMPDETKGLAIQTSKSEIEKKEEEQEQPAVTISNQEKDLFDRLVEAEAKGESYEGKVAVATVVLNRVDSPKFPNTVTDVIKQVVGDCYAFSPVQNGEISKPASAESKRAVDEALTRKDRLNDAIYFYNPDIATDDWIRTRNVVKTIGNHVFAK